MAGNTRRSGGPRKVRVVGGTCSCSLTFRPTKRKKIVRGASISLHSLCACTQRLSFSDWPLCVRSAGVVREIVRLAHLDPHCPIRTCERSCRAMAWLLKLRCGAEPDGASLGLCAASEPWFILSLTLVPCTSTAFWPAVASTTERSSHYTC